MLELSEHTHSSQTLLHGPGVLPPVLPIVARAMLRYTNANHISPSLNRPSTTRSARRGPSPAQSSQPAHSQGHSLIHSDDDFIDKDHPLGRTLLICLSAFFFFFFFFLTLCCPIRLDVYPNSPL